MEATLENLMKTIVEQRDEMIMLRSMNQRMEQLRIDMNEYTIQMLDQPTPESHHTDISADRYNDAHSNMSTDGQTIKLILLIYNNFSIVKKVAKKISMG